MKRPLLALAAALLLAAVTAPTASAASAASADCLGLSSARVPKWAPNAHEPTAIGALQAERLAQQLAPAVADAEQAAARGQGKPGLVTVRTWVHVISKNRRPAGGNVSDAQIQAQIDVLNRSYAGATGGAPTVFRFALAGVTRTVNKDWAKMDAESPEEAAAKLALHRGGPSTLNLYVVAQLGADLLGWSYLPDGTVEHTDTDGVVVLAGSLPGGDVAPYNEGDTATHEVGHWLALEHTFENGCDFPGDSVPDTPYEAEPAFDCVVRDTCKQPGNDPIENFMDYTDDACMHEFSLGQSLRMWGAWRTFRS
jgi:hypothetical protein